MRHRLGAGRTSTAVAVIVGVFAAALVAAGLAPGAADAQLGLPVSPPGLSNPIDGIGKVIGGGAKEVADKVGASVLKEGLEWLTGGMKAAITLGLVKSLTTIELPVGGSLEKATGPIIVIGGFFLVVGLITSIGDGYREIIAGTDTAPRVIGSAIFRVIGLAALLGAWFWVVPLAVDMANGMSGYVLSDPAVGKALKRTFASESLLSAGFPLLGFLTAIFMAMALLVLVVLKYVIAIMFACLYVGGPALIGFSALPRIGGMAVSLAIRGVLTLMVIPLAWTIVFVAWAGVSAGIADTAKGEGGSLVTALMGPGLFLAGLVVMLAVTKKVLAMASFGLALKVPGTGIAKLFTKAVGAKVAGPAGAAVADKVTGGGKGAGPSAEEIPTKGTIAAANAAASGVTRPSGQQGKRPRNLNTDGTGGGNPQPDFVARQRQRAEVETANEESRLRDAGSLLKTKDGAPQPLRGEPPQERAQALQARVNEIRSGFGDGVTPQQLQENAGHLRAGDRAAFGKYGAHVGAERGGHPNLAAAQYEQVMGDQVAAHIDPARHPGAFESSAWAIAAGPSVAAETFRGDATRHTWKDTGATTQPRPVQDGRGNDYSGGIFGWGRQETV